MNLMLDSNIIIDHIGRREPFYELSRKVCLLGIAHEAQLYLSVSMITDIHYLLRKDYGSQVAQDMIERDLSFLQLVSVTPHDIHKALSERWSDFKDCIVALCAQKVHANYIITRNVKDFERSAVPAITPKELFEQLEKRGIVYEEIEIA